MSETPSTEPNSGEIALDDLDSLLDQEDPGFRSDLKSVSDVKPEAELDNDGALDLADQGHSDDELSDHQDQSRWKKLKGRIRTGLAFQLSRLKTELISFSLKALIFLKTRPLDLLRYLLSLAKSLTQQLALVSKKFSYLPRSQKLLIFVVIGLSVGVVLLTMKNLKGTWIPTLNPPLVTSLSQVADEVFVIAPEAGEAFYRAFPRDPDIFLFKKFKVNLKPSDGHPNPMGAFEVVVQLDSKEAAIESQEREVELHDFVQREFENQTYPSLLSDLGKQQLKNHIKKVVDDRLSQGWVEDVHFQTFILKP